MSPQTQPGQTVVMGKDADSGLEINNSRTLVKIVALSTAIAFGGGFASDQALRLSSGGFSFEFSGGTVVAFLAGIVFGLLFWRLAAAGRRGVWMAVWLMILVGVGLFLYPLRFVSPGVLPQVATGLVTAICALSILGFLVWQVKRFLDADTREGAK